MKKIVIVGATSSIAEHCARLWVTEQPVHLILIGRDLEKTERVAADLRVRSPESVIESMIADFVEPSKIEKTVESLFKESPVDLVLIAHGYLPEQSACEKDLELCKTTLIINAVSPALYAEAFARYFEEKNAGVVAVIGSVAGDRGRKSNYVYGAAKGLIKNYMQGMQHRFAGKGVRAILINPGPTDTPMTVNYKKQGMKMASPEAVAKGIVDGIKAGKSVIYVPGVWRFIMLVVQHIPACIFNKINI